MTKKLKNITKVLGKPETTKDKILQWYLSPGLTELTKKEEKIRKRWSSCFALLCKYHSPQQAVSVLMKEFSISEPQAYRDVKNSISVFGDIGKSEKEGYRHILFEYSMKVFQLAASNNDLKEMNKSISNMISLKGLDKEDPDLPDFSKLTPNIYEIVVDEESNNILKKLSNLGVIDISDIKID